MWLVKSIESAIAMLAAIALGIWPLGVFFDMGLELVAVILAGTITHDVGYLMVEHTIR